MASSSHHAYRENVLALRHKIFLSYSGADHDFVYELYHDLRELDYNPFFDQKSLPKGEAVSMGNIVQEAADCKLAVFVLSEFFFTRNKNPMLEVVECVKHGVRLLPLFYKISVDTIKSSRHSWDAGKWTEWGVDRIQFMESLETLLHISGIENKENSRSRDYRKRVLDEIQRIIPLDTLPDLSDIYGKDRLVKVVKGIFDEHLLEHTNTHPAVVLGLYGASGTGKSTLCRILEHCSSDFQCRVCNIQLDNSGDNTTQLSRMKNVLKYVTKLSRDSIDRLKTIEQAQNKLYEQEFENNVFFVIDNVVPPDSLEEARIYLDGRCHFKSGSKILVTAHIEGVLSGLGLLNQGLKWHIAAMPDLEKEDATQILLKRAGSIDIEDDLVERCLKLSQFQKGGGKGHHFHPLMLKALSESLAENLMDMRSWITSLETRFSYTDAIAKEKVLQQMLRSTSYEGLNALQKQVFLDVAFYLPTGVDSREEIIEWLDMVHGRNTKEAVWILERRGLIDLSDCKAMNNDWCYSLRQEPLMHDLYYEMAYMIVEERESECLFFQGDSWDKVLPPLHSCKKLKRIRFDNCNFSGDLVLPHRHFASLQVLDVRFCKGMGKLDLRGPVRLRSLNLHGPEGSFHKIRDLADCDSLFHLSILYLEEDRIKRILRSNVTLPIFDSYIPANRNRTGSYIPNVRNFIVQGIIDFDAPFDFSSCIHLKKLILNVVCHHPVLPTLTNLREFHLTCFDNDSHDLSVELDFRHKIEKIYIHCNHVSALRGLNRNCNSIRDLSLFNCAALKDVDFLGEITSLERVSLYDLNITALPKQLLKLGNQLESLDISRCFFIKPEDRIDVLSTPDLPQYSPQQIICDLTEMFPKNVYIEVMEPSIQDIQPPQRDLKISDPLGFDAISRPKLDIERWQKPNPDMHLEHWERNLSLAVESKEALHTISEHIRYIQLLHTISERIGDIHFRSNLHDSIHYALALVLYLCVGGRYVHLRELLTKPHVVEAFIQAQLPFGLIVLAIAKQHFGADLESHPSHPATIANMVAQTYSKEAWEWFAVSCFQTCARECAASIALSNPWILKKLPPKVHHQVLNYEVRYNEHSCFDGTQELSYVTNNEHTPRCCYL